MKPRPRRMRDSRRHHPQDGTTHSGLFQIQDRDCAVALNADERCSAVRMERQIHRPYPQMEGTLRLNVSAKDRGNPFTVAGNPQIAPIRTISCPSRRIVRMTISVGRSTIRMQRHMVRIWRSVR